MPSDYKYPLDEDEPFEIYSNLDKRLEYLGKALKNESSRKIYCSLVKENLSISQISKKVDISLENVHHHMKNLKNAGLVKRHDMKYGQKNNVVIIYKAISSIIILNEPQISKAKEDKNLLKSIKKYSKFAVIGFAGIVSWFATLSLKSNKIPVQRGSSDIESNQIYNVLLSFIDQLIIHINPIIITSIVIIIGIILILKIKKIRGPSH